MNNRVLILNADYSPMMVCTIERAIVLVILGKSELLHKAKDKCLRSVSQVFPVPLVIRVVNYVNIPYKKVALTRLNIFKRDGFECQYCSRNEHLTIDHVVPKSKGGESTWKNLVTACSRCNSLKGDRTPTEAKMKLQNMPFRPTYASFLLNFSGYVCDEWMPYLKIKKRA